MKNEDSQKSRVGKDDIKVGLAGVGLSAGDVVMVHSSLSAFGYVEGGADAVIDALLETVGPDGTVVMPTFTWGSFAHKSTVEFDVAGAPSEVGKITEVFRNRPEATRSVHVCHSVAAIGPHTQAVMGDGRNGSGRGSSFDGLLELDAWNLFLGVDFSVCTALHTVEEFMQVPYREHRDFKGSTVILPDGTRVPSESVEYLRKPCYRNDLRKMGDVFAGARILRTAEVGDATIINVRIRDIISVTTKLMEEDIGFLLTAESRELLAGS